MAFMISKEEIGGGVPPSQELQQRRCALCFRDGGRIVMTICGRGGVTKS